MSVTYHYGPFMVGEDVFVIRQDGEAVAWFRSRVRDGKLVGFEQFGPPWLEQYEVVEGRAQIDKEWGDNCSCSRTPMYQHVTGCEHLEEDSIMQYVGRPAILLVKKP